MSISARVVADSINPSGQRLTTFVLRYPRMVHSEFMTHRVISKNSASSRAIPGKRMRKDIRQDMAGPVYWGSQNKGMSAGPELTGLRLFLAKTAWKVFGYIALFMGWFLEKCGLHKQIANRVIEPWSHITVIATATTWTNFYSLRIHPSAQPEIKALAEAMLEAQNASVPKRVGNGHWHLPFVEESEADELGISIALKVSVARCARVSYLNHEGRQSSIRDDIALYNRLLGSAPVHASPSEHQATPIAPDQKSGNFTGGWLQHRELIKDNNATSYPYLTIQ